MSTNDDKEAVIKAAQSLSSGRLVAFPTETVYGLGADASNSEALSLLYKVKGRPAQHPVIVHLSKLDEIEKWACNPPDAAYVLGKLFWPGPLTMVLKKTNTVLDEVTGGQDTVGIRIPSHPLALALLNEFGGGIAAPSANKYGKLSPTSAEDVKTEFGDEIDMVLDGGFCQVGIESTIVDLSTDEPRILRPGMIQAESIYVALAELGLKASSLDAEVKPRVPGSTLSHYAPKTALRIVSSENICGEIDALERQGTEAAVLSFKPAPMLHRHWITMKRFPSHYAQLLYKNLRKLDLLGADIIIVEEPPADADWDGIRDRLNRAAGSPGQTEEGYHGS